MLDFQQLLLMVILYEIMVKNLKIFFLAKNIQKVLLIFVQASLISEQEMVRQDQQPTHNNLIQMDWKQQFKPLLLFFSHSIIFYAGRHYWCARSRCTFSGDPYHWQFSGNFVTHREKFTRFMRSLRQNRQSTFIHVSEYVPQVCTGTYVLQRAAYARVATPV